MTVSPKVRFVEQHRQARLGNLGTLATSVARDRYEWLLSEVYDLRHPRVGTQRHLRQRTFDPLRGRRQTQAGTAVRVIND